MAIETPFNQIFRNNNPFGKTFNECIQQKIVVCPTFGFYLKKKQFLALMKTIKQQGESSFYMILTEWNYSTPQNNQTSYFDPGPWEFSCDLSYEEYSNIKLVFENALFSKEGKWGIIVSHEDHAVLGSSSEFMELFKSFYTDAKKDLEYFVKMWNYNQKHYKSDVT